MQKKFSVYYELRTLRRCITYEGYAANECFDTSKTLDRNI